MSKSEENLIGFYRAIGNSDVVKWVENEQFGAIVEPNGNWPQLVYRFQFVKQTEKNIGIVLSELASQNSRMLAICNEADFKKLDAEKLREASVLAIDIWEAMEFKTQSGIRKPIDFDYDIRQLTDKGALTEFTNLVNTDMMRSLKMPELLFGDLLDYPGFEFHGLYVENKIVSGLIVFTGNNTSGLYFIVTKAIHRGKGLAENLIIKTLLQLFEKGTENVVLQAVNKAVPLYTRIGFESTGKLVLLMNN